MNDPHDDLDRRLRPPVEPMDTPPGTFAAVRRRARRRRWMQVATTATTVLVVCAGGVSGALVATGDRAPGEVPHPVVASRSSAAPASPHSSSPSTQTSSPTTPASTDPATDAAETSGPERAAPDEEASTPEETVDTTEDTGDGDDSGNTGVGDGTTPPADEPELTRCHTADLSARITPEGAAAGTVYATLVFTNESGSACTLNGHPGMLLLNAKKEPLPTDVLKKPPEPHRVVLDPGGAASATLHWGNVPTGDEPCQPPSDYALVTPPDAYEQLTLSFQSSSCHGTIYMTSVVAGDDGAA